MKIRCRASRAFDYRGYMNEVGTFLEEVTRTAEAPAASA
jgi:hypothetical protein